MLLVDCYPIELYYHNLSLKLRAVLFRSSSTYAMLLIIKFYPEHYAVCIASFLHC